jgi:hypothetical protein
MRGREGTPRMCTGTLWENIQMRGTQRRGNRGGTHGGTNGRVILWASRQRRRRGGNERGRRG